MANDYVNIGDRLRQKRKELGKELEEISDEIKVSTEYLKAIEGGEIKVLPSIVYYKLFVRSYAQELGLDPEQLFEEFGASEADFKNKEVENSKSQKIREKKSKSGNEISLLKVGLILGLVVIIAFIIILIFSSGSDKTDVVDVPYSSDTMANTIDNSNTYIEDSLMPVEKDTPPFTADRPMILDIIVRDSCWILVIADGDKVLERTLEPGVRKSIEINYRFAISMGNRHGTEIRLNDTLLRNPLVGETLEINQRNKRDFYLIPEDTLTDEY